MKTEKFYWVLVGNGRLLQHTKYWQVIPLFFFVVACKSIEVPSDRKTIGDRKYKEVVYVTESTPRPKPKRAYHWFKSQQIYNSQNDYAGLLLHGEYVKYYYSNELAEKGNFRNGLKIGKWTSWHRNGYVSQVTKWKKGRQSGRFVSRDSLGDIIAYGNYMKGTKKGKWVYPVKGDTVFYKKGKIIEADTIKLDSLAKPSLIKRIFGKKESLEGPDHQKLNPVADSSKTGFLKRLFKKGDSKKRKSDSEPTKKNRTVKTDPASQKPEIKVKKSNPNRKKSRKKEKGKTNVKNG